MAEPDERALSTYFAACNRNKRSVAVDIATDAGVALVRKLAAQADIRPATR